MTRSNHLGLLVLIWLGIATSSNALQITHVMPERNYLQQPGEGTLGIRFSISEPAQITLNIYDARGYLMRSVGGNALLKAGKHEVEWDGKDDAGRVLSPGVYNYTIEGTDAAGEHVLYDLTDLTGGEAIAVLNSGEQPADKTITYQLGKPARVNIRIGLQEGGPLLRTIRDWVPRNAGKHTEHWNGLDASGVIKLAEHPRREMTIQAFSLPDNSIFVGEPQAEEQLVALGEKVPEKRRINASQRPEVLGISRQSPESRGEIGLSLILPGVKAEAGVLRVSGRTPVRLDVAEKDRQRVVERRFEAAFYVDGLLAFENETGFLPMTWYLDAENMNPGTHYITANVITYGGNFGVQTVKVEIGDREAKEK